MKVLVFCLQDWSMNFVFVCALRKAGFSVDLLTKKGYLAARNADVSRLYEINPADDFILFELFRAIKESSPKIIFPSDEIALYYMHQAVLAKENGSLKKEFEPLVEFIQKSLPKREYVFTANNKSAFLDEVKFLGFSAPQNYPSKTVAEAKNFAVKIGYPVLLKLDKSFGGSGVRVCKDEKELEENFAEFSTHKENGIAVQQILDGIEAKIEMVCIDGKLIDAYSSKKLSKILFGPSDSNIVMENKRALEFAQKIVEKFGYNGFCDCDMIIVDNEPYFLEMNPRKVPHHCFKFDGLDMTRSMFLGLGGEEIKEVEIYRDEITIFPLNLVNYPPNDEILFTAKNTIDLENPHLMAILAEREFSRILEAGNFDKAVRFFEKMFELHPFSWSLCLAKAILLIKTGRLAEAREVMQKAAILSGGDPLALIYEILVLDAAGEIEALILEVEKFLGKREIKQWMIEACADILEKNNLLERFDLIFGMLEGESTIGARRFILKGDFETAYKILLDVLEREKQNAKAWNMLQEIKQNINPSFLNRLHLQSDCTSDALSVFAFQKGQKLDPVGIELDPIEAVILQFVSLSRSYEEVFLGSMNKCNALGFCESFKIGAKEKKIPHTPQTFKDIFYPKIQKLADQGMIILFA